MPKKIENPLVTGLPAKIYFLLYVDPQSGYSLAKKIYGFPRTDKIYKWTKRLIDDGYLKQIKGKGRRTKFQAITKPLLQQIKELLEERAIYLTDVERKILKDLLDSTEFKKYIFPLYERETQQRSVYDGEKIINISKPDFNASKIISEIIGMAATLSYIKLEFKDVPIEYDEKNFAKIYRKSNPNNWQTTLDGIKVFNKMIVFFKPFSKDSLLRLSKLWPPSHFLIVDEYVNFYKKHKKIIKRLSE